MPFEKQFSCQVLTPEGPVFAEDVEYAVFPAIDGQIGILPNRAPLVAQLGSGTMAMRRGRENWLLHIEGGFAEMRHNALTILAERARPIIREGVRSSKQELADARRSLGLTNGDKPPARS